MAKIRGKWQFDENKMNTINAMLADYVEQEVTFSSSIYWSGMWIDLNNISRQGVTEIRFLKADGTTTTAWSKNSGWTNEDYRVVDFGEKEKTVSDLFYQIFTAVATLAAPLYSLKGAWMWRENVHFTEGVTQFINFHTYDSSAGTIGATYTSMSLYAGNETVDGRLNIYYDSTLVSYGDFSQINNSYRYINFGEEEQAVSTGFYEEFTANAVPYDGVRPTAPLDKVLVFYNGCTPIELAPGKGIRLPTRDHQMKTRLTVLAGLEAGAEVYFDGVLCATLTGRQAHRLFCAGKGMNGNIAVVNTLETN